MGSSRSPLTCGTHRISYTHHGIFAKDLWAVDMLLIWCGCILALDWRATGVAQSVRQDCRRRRRRPPFMIKQLYGLGASGVRRGHNRLAVITLRTGRCVVQRRGALRLWCPRRALIPGWSLGPFRPWDEVVIPNDMDLRGHDHGQEILQQGEK